MSDVEQLFQDIINSRSPGHFHEVGVVLRKYCELAIASRGLSNQIHAEIIGTNEHWAVLERHIAISDEMMELAEILRILPGDQHLPPPRRQ